MDIVIKSLVSAVVTAIILVVAKYSGPRLAGAIGGIPIVFAISYIMLTLHDKSGAKDFLIGGIYGAVAAIFFSFILIWLNEQFFKLFWFNFAVAYILTFFLALGMVHYFSK